MFCHFALVIFCGWENRPKRARSLQCSGHGLVSVGRKYDRLCRLVLQNSVSTHTYGHSSWMGSFWILKISTLKWSVRHLRPLEWLFLRSGGVNLENIDRLCAGLVGRSASAAFHFFEPFSKLGYFCGSEFFNLTVRVFWMSHIAVRGHTLGFFFVFRRIHAYAS